MNAATYGATELKSAMYRYATMGLVISVTIHLSIILGLLLLPSFKYPFGVSVSIGGTIHDPILLNHPIVPGIPTIPHSGGKSESSKERNAVPVPVPGGDPEVTMTPQEKMAGMVDPGDGEVSGTNGSEILIPEEKPPDPFVPVEKMPEVIRRVTPAYPDMAQRMGLEGKVWVRVWVDREGKVRQAEVTRSDAEVFNESALTAARQYLFTPAVMNAGPVSVWVWLKFTFAMADRAK